MGRGLVLLALAATAVLLGACGGEDVRFSDAKVVRALDLQKAENSYSVGGQPFCKVTKILNDADEVDKTPSEFVLASPARNVGVQVKPPFIGACEKQVHRALTKLDPTDE